MLGQRHRRWTNLEPAQGENIVFTEIDHSKANGYIEDSWELYNNPNNRIQGSSRDTIVRQINLYKLVYCTMESIMYSALQ